MQKLLGSGVWRLDAGMIPKPKRSSTNEPIKPLGSKFAVTTIRDMTRKTVGMDPIRSIRPSASRIPYGTLC